MTRDDELTPQQQERLRTLPREQMPSRALEDRTIAALQARGALRQARWASPMRVGMAVAASLALFAGGVFYGEWRASASPRPDAARPSDRVRTAGSAYVAAIGALTRGRQTSSGEELAAAQAAALDALHQAAGEVMLLVPEDPVAEGILVSFDQATSEERANDEGVRRIVWF